MGYIHLQVHSGFTFMESTLTIEKLVKGAKEKGYDTIAITDRNVLHGAVQFYQQCKAEGITPIIGMETSITFPFRTEPIHFIFLAKSNRGYEQLLKLSTLIQMSDTKTTAVEKAQLYIDDVVTILPASQFFQGEGTGQAFDQVINSITQHMPTETLYLGIQEHGHDYEIIANEQANAYVTEQQHAELVALHDVRYLQEEDEAAYDCLRSIKEGRFWSKDRLRPDSRNRSLLSEGEMERKFQAYPGAVQNTMDIAAMCSNLSLKLGQHLLPKFPTPPNYTSEQYLTQLCEERLKEKYVDNIEIAKERLRHELRVINGKEFSDYFLIVWDFMKYAKQENIMTGPGRGSAAGSLVAYLLDITEVDPIEYDLLFERFLNPERMSMPDIDIDFSDHRRDEVIQYVLQKYGDNRVAQIVTFGTFAPRSLLRELMKTMGIDKHDEQYLLKEISPQVPSLRETVKGSDTLRQYISNSESLKTLFKVGVKLEGLPRHHSTHAAGVVISDRPLYQYVPLMSGHHGVALTQYPMNDLEQIGLLKMDFLGLRNLSLMEQIVKRVQKFEDNQFSLKHISLHDPLAYRLLQKGKTTGIFQLESSGMKKVLTQLKPEHIEDVVAVNALYRPGPMEYIPTFIKRKHGEETVTYPHPDLKPILKRTYGVLIYQEQIMQIANRIGDYSLGEADILRRAVSKKQKDVLTKEREKFVQKCMANGYDQQVAEKIYDWIVRFANYGFNRSHAVAYSLISYQLAYLKAHYPAYFFAELLSSVSHNQEKLREYVKEAKDFRLKILSPSINHSYSKFTVEGKQNLRMSLLVIKGVGKQAVDAIVAARGNKPFRNLFDFCQRVPLKTVNRSVLESLILAGAFDETYDNRASLLASLDQALEQGELFGGFSAQETLFGDQFTLDSTYTETEPFSTFHKLALEKDMVGMYLSSHPLATYRKQLRRRGIVSIRSMLDDHIGNNVSGVAVLQNMRVIRTKRGDQMAFVTFVDESDEIDGVIFPDLYRTLNRWIKEELIVFVKGKVDLRNGEPQWVVQHMETFDLENEQEVTTKEKLFIRLYDRDEKHQLTKIKKIADKYPGEVPVIVYSSRRKETYQLSEQFYIKPVRDCLHALKDIFGEGNVALKRSDRA
ncbi:DNA polymerase III subunit alpha [Salirhabdus salicampi]|uniref:DNA polymerase III subunit alpha n=1 Tax=Salirhabdus salicampi TaxID=476102 RepID=UPI0020C33EF7|nr:DNA polymerase III subunit alpha [Salirhabdus salicampi]MCP8617105.1 DNA polymerase III subunit alpha [Salirhabdus salicampi]